MASTGSNMTEVRIFKTGCCHHPEFITLKGGAWKKCEFPAISVLIRHPQHGLLLFDTGYSEAFLNETKRFPNKLYRMITPVTYQPEQSIKAQLQAIDIAPEDIKYIILSHYHADHISGLNDFPNARYIASRQAYDELSKTNSLISLKNGFLPGLLPADFETRLLPIEKMHESNLPSPLYPFTEGFDVFGDGTLYLVELPGHALGHYGLFINSENPQFFIGDACWSRDTFEKLRLPNKIANLIFTDKNAYIATVHKLHHLWQRNNNIKIIPSHCSQSIVENMR